MLCQRDRQTGQCSDSIGRTVLQMVAQRRFCLANLLEFMENVCGYVDKGLPVNVMYLGFKKAFDKVSHGRLLHERQLRHARGIVGKILAWTKEWLNVACKELY